MKKHVLLFAALCAMTVGCGDTETADNSSPPSEETKVAAAPESTPKESEKETEKEAEADAPAEVAKESETEAPAETAEVAKTSEESFKALNREFNKAMTDFRKEWMAEKDEEAKSELVKTKLPKAEDYSERFLAIYESDPDSEFGMKALEWVAGRDREGDAGKKAFNLLLTNHSDSEALPGMIFGLQRGKPQKNTEDLLRDIIDGDGSPEVKGTATMALAAYLQNVDEMKGSIEDYKEMFGEETISYIENLEVGSEELLSLYGTVKEGLR